MNKNKIFSAIMRGFEVSGINALSSAAGSSSVNGALQGGFELLNHFIHCSSCINVAVQEFFCSVVHILLLLL